MSKFTVMGVPVGKERARTVTLPNGMRRSYTPKKTKDYESLIAYEYKRQCGEFYGDMENSKLKQAVVLKIDIYFSIPKSYNKGKRLAAECNSIRPTKKPDIDNVVKSVLDALNGVAYKDDTQVTELSVRKWWTADNDRIDVWIDKAKVGTQNDGQDENSTADYWD